MLFGAVNVQTKNTCTLQFSTKIGFHLRSVTRKKRLVSFGFNTVKFFNFILYINTKLVKISWFKRIDC